MIGRTEIFDILIFFNRLEGPKKKFVADWKDQVQCA
jgi:hypothetical protein